MVETLTRNENGAARPGAPVRSAPKVGILGHFGDRNLGDEAMIEAFLARMRRRWPGIEVRIFSMHPSDSARRYDCRAYAIRQETEYEQEYRIPAAFAAPTTPDSPPTDTEGPAESQDPPRTFMDRIARLVPKGRLRSAGGSIARAVLEMMREIGFLWRSIGRARGLDVMYVTGSNQFLDNFGGPWGFPYTLLKWTAICRLVGCRVVYVSKGAGPLDGALSKWMIARALGMADYLSFRDVGSRELIRKACGHDGPVVADLANSLDTDWLEPPADPSPRANGRLRIFINAMPVYDPRYWHAADPAKYRAYTTAIGEVTRTLQGLGHDVTFFATQFPDAAVARDVLDSRIAVDGAADVAIEVPPTVTELLALLNGADIVIATRFHGIMMALLLGKPTVGICYYRKSRELLAEAQMSDFAFDIDDIDSAAVVAAVRRLALSMDATEAIIRLRTSRLRAQLDRQYETLWRHLEGRRAPVRRTDFQSPK